MLIKNFSNIMHYSDLGLRIKNGLQIIILHNTISILYK